ncbi:MAG: hypothetical protein KDD69_14330, partial [Bdellovibrionales bacterium]|nr:hypothetical protein [Bdellovibrionales bacterium]
MSLGWSDVEQKLAGLYGASAAAGLVADIQALPRQSAPASTQPLTERDAALICYANSVVDRAEETAPLAILRQWLKQHAITDTLSIVHLLPFYPWDTDRGFSVKDFYQVEPSYGSWEDIRCLANECRLMFDFVANHASIENPLVQSALIERHLSPEDSRYQEHARYREFVLAFSQEERPTENDLKQLARPRAAPVLSPYVVFDDGGALRASLGTSAPDGRQQFGSGWVWTTFSRLPNADGSEATRQVDLNFKNPSVFLEAVRILVFYRQQGASLIRLDAIGYLWKKFGSTSLHEPQTHELLQALDGILKLLLPEVITIAEVNEPQEKVLPYLGTEAASESDLVYQFSHFPLAVHAVQTGSAQHYSEWLRTLPPFGGRQFITVLGSHDGLGMKPARGLLPEGAVSEMIERLVDEHGGLPNFAVLPGGERIVYEVCATPWDLINPGDSEEPLALQIDRYLAVVALGLLPRGLPAFYINGILGRSG